MRISEISAKDVKPYQTLNDKYPAGNTEIWFARDEMSNPDPDNLSATHVLVGKISETEPKNIFGMMQGEVLSPQGEAEAFMRRMGISRTSMRPGDVIKTGNDVLVVTKDGFDNVNKTESYVKESSELFQALALRHIMLQEGRLDEASIWDTVKGTVGGVMRGIKSADDAVNKLGSIAQQTQPVKAFDSKVDEIVASIKEKLGSKAPKAVATAEKYAEWAKKNPIKQGMIIGALTAVAALAGGPGAAAAAGFILRTANEYMKGEKASTAIGKGVKTAAVGAGLSYLAGLSLDALKSGLTLSMPDAPPLPNIKQLVTPKFIYTLNGNPIFQSGNIVMPVETAKEVSGLLNQFMNLKDTNLTKATASLEKAWNLITDPNLVKRVEEITKDNAASKAVADAAMDAWYKSAANIASFNNQMKELIPILKNAAAGAIQGTAASGTAAQAGSAIKGAAAKATDLYRGFVPSKVYSQVNKQLGGLSAADKQKLVSYLQQELGATA